MTTNLSIVQSLIFDSPNKPFFRRLSWIKIDASIGTIHSVGDYQTLICEGSQQNRVTGTEEKHERPAVKSRLLPWWWTRIHSFRSLMPQARKAKLTLLGEYWTEVFHHS